MIKLLRRGNERLMEMLWWRAVRGWFKMVLSGKMRRRLEMITGCGVVSLVITALPHFWLHKSGIDVPPQLKEGAFMWDIPPATGWHVHIASCRIVGVMPWLDGTNEMNNFHISSKLLESWSIGITSIGVHVVDK